MYHRDLFTEYLHFSSLQFPDCVVVGQSPHPPTSQLHRHMQQPVPLAAPCCPFRRQRRRQPPRADVDLQRLVDQARLGQLRIALAAPAHKVGLGRALLEVLVALALFGDGREGLWRGALA